MISLLLKTPKLEKIIPLVIVLLVFIYLIISCRNIQVAIESQQNLLASLMLDMANIEDKIHILQNRIIELKAIVPSSSLPDSNLWSWCKPINFICLGLILTTFVGAKVFFANTPYLVNYTAKSWNFDIMSYLYPVIWTKDHAPRIIRDGVDNLFRLALDTDLDTFILHAQLAGTTKAITIAEFIQWVLHLP